MKIPIIVIIICLLAISGYAQTTPNYVSVTKTVGVEENSTFPLCGVLSDKGYALLSFLVPRSSDEVGVFRYEVVGYDKLFPPLEIDAGWWICVTKGKIVSAPETAHPDIYGKLRIIEYLSDESNGEKGQE